MAFRVQQTGCPRCKLLININDVAVDEAGTLRIEGTCPKCNVIVVRDVDIFTLVANAAQLQRLGAANAMQRTSPLKLNS